MVFYLLLCPSCNNLHYYEYVNAGKRVRKKCTRCDCKFEITKKRIIREFETRKECLKAHQLLAYHLHNDQRTITTHDKLLEKMRKSLSEGFSKAEAILEKTIGHQASSHDHVTNLYALPRLVAEVDRLHWTSFLDPSLYHLLLSRGYSPAKDFGDIVFKDSFGTVFVRSTGQLEGYCDFSKPHIVAQLEGLLSFFKNLCGHDDHLQFKTHDHELTIKINCENKLAEVLLNKYGHGMKASFLQQQFKTYFSAGKELRNEAQSATDLITGLEAQYNEQLSKQGINVLVYGENDQSQDYSGEVQAIQQKMILIEDKVDILLDGFNDFMKNQSAMNENQTSLSSLTLEMDTRLESNQERILGQIQRNYVQNTEILQVLYKDNTSSFVQKCDTIVEKLTERASTLDDLEIVLGQKKQGLVRYLSELKEKGLITYDSIKTGKKGRPRKLWRMKEQ